MTSDPLSRYLVNRTSRTSRRERLRPMTSSEVLDMALSVYQALGWTILKLTALPTVFCLASVAFVWEYVLPSFGLTNHPSDVKAQVGEAAATIGVGIGVGGPLFLLGLAYSSGVVVTLVSDHMLGRTPNAASAAASGLRVLRRLFLLMLYEVMVGWSGVLAATGLLMVSALMPADATGDAWAAAATGTALFAYLIGFIVLPAVLVRHALAPAVCVLESLGSRATAKRSVALMKATPWQPSGYPAAWLITVCVLLLILLLLPGLSAGLGAIGISSDLHLVPSIPLLDMLLARAIEQVPSYLAIWTLVPVWCAGVTILYYERRVRLEGFDIEALAADVRQADRRSKFEL
ncbi:MAG: hypothetical protein HZC36_02610 [Armatimonadetes bacterium]|nr:hypothetical protein [Armatimonadota bacterium]